MLFFACLELCVLHWAFYVIVLLFSIYLYYLNCNKNEKYEGRGMNDNLRRWKRKATQICALVLVFAVFAASENLTRAFAAETVQQETQEGVLSVSDGNLSEADTVSGNMLLQSGGSGLALLEDYKLYKVEGGNSTQVQSGSGELYSSDSLLAQYDLVQLLVNAALDPDNCNVASGGVYSFPVPDGLLVTEVSDWVVQVNIAGSNEQLGTASYEEGVVKLALDNAELFNGSVDSVENAFVQFTCKLDSGFFADGGETQKLNFGFGSQPEFTFTYGDNKKTDSTVDKSGVYDPTAKRTVWTVTVTEGSRAYGGDLMLKDTLSANQDYIPGTFKMDGIGIADDLLDWNQTAQGESVLSYVYTPAGTEGDQQLFTYETRFNNGIYVQNDKLAGAVSLQGSNHVELINVGDSDVISEKTATVGDGSLTEMKWLQKTGTTAVIAGDILETVWTITVDTKGFSFDQLTLFDSLICKPANSGSELAAEKQSVFSVVTGSLQVEKDGVPAACGMSQAGGAGNAQITKGNDDGTAAGDGGFQWKLVLGETGAKGVYKITYKTQISRYSEYRKYNQEKIKNTAEVTFD